MENAKHLENRKDFTSHFVPNSGKCEILPKGVTIGNCETSGKYETFFMTFILENANYLENAKQIP